MTQARAHVLLPSHISHSNCALHRNRMCSCCVLAFCLVSLCPCLPLHMDARALPPNIHVASHLSGTTSPCCLSWLMTFGLTLNIITHFILK